MKNNTTGFTHKLAVGSAILVAIGLYWLAAQLTAPRYAGQLTPRIAEKAIAELTDRENKQAKSSDETINPEAEFGKHTLRISKELAEQLRQLQMESDYRPPIFFEYPPGHPYGRRIDSDVIIKSSGPLSGKPFQGIDRDLLLRLEQAATNRSSGDD